MHNASALLTRIKNAIVQNINPETVMLLQADQQSTCDRVVNSDFFNANAYTEPGNMKTIMCKFFNATAADPTEFRPGVTLVISNMSLCTDDDSKTDESCPQNGCCGYGQCTADTEQKNQVCHFDRDHLLDIEFSVHNPEDSDVQSVAMVTPGYGHQ
ncbi:unnamed protein product [Albugo candida]|uniref:Uncharacterized protein n=1 Tax=Albugo candida TaxID=65357 RepID=A0A024FVM7_9STRA|nr:unnamed protein product [Albugo candida]|eukprot:CCI11180.1 unnamed protein product [Albugo candida]